MEIEIVRSPLILPDGRPHRRYHRRGKRHRPGGGQALFALGIKVCLADLDPAALERAAAEVDEPAGSV